MRTLAQLALAGLGCLILDSSTHLLAQTPVEAGEQLFDANCAGCHGERISNPNNFFDLKQLGQDERARFDKSVREGKGQMPAWEGTFTNAEFDSLWVYIRSMAN